MPHRIFLFCVLAGSLSGQSRPEFEVASMKPSAGGEGRSIGMGRAGDFSAKNIQLNNLIAEAYRVKTFQICGGPGWIGSESYDITTKHDADAKDAPSSKEAFEKIRADTQLKLQALLEERCALKVHRETKELPVYTLIIAKSGPKLQPSNCVTFDFKNPPTAPAPGQHPPENCGNSRTSRKGLISVMDGYGITIADIVRWLSKATDRTVIDKTGYTQPFNAHVEWAPDIAAEAPADTNAPSLFKALQEQLGLKLESTKGPVEVLVIDHVEKPTAN